MCPFCLLRLMGNEYHDLQNRYSLSFTEVPFWEVPLLFMLPKPRTLIMWESEVLWSPGVLESYAQFCNSPLTLEAQSLGAGDLGCKKSPSAEMARVSSDKSILP